MSDPVYMGDQKPVKVTVSDPDTGEMLEEIVLTNDYTVVCAGSCEVTYTQVHANGTHMLTIKGRKNG